MDLPAGLYLLFATAALPPLLDALGRLRRAEAFRPRPASGRRPERVLALIPARAEGERMLPLCRDVAREAAAAGTRVETLVILDGADPAAEAALAGESIPFLVKSPAGPSKGKALAFATDTLQARTPDPASEAEFVMVFDSDMRLEAGFFSRLAVPEGTEAFQLPVRPSGIPASAPARVEALSLALATRVEDLARDAEGLPVRLRGKAMGFSPRAWREGPAASSRTTAEDSEATLRLLARGIVIRALPCPFAFDEPAGDAGTLARPRARWFAGHLNLLMTGAGDLAKIAARDPRAAFVLAADLWLRPRALVLVSLSIVALASDVALVVFALRGETASLVPPLLASVLSKAALVLEVRAATTARAALGTPSEVPPVSARDLAEFAVVWLRAVARAFLSPGRWHRARTDA
ncbi:MAG: glycosyltransferase [Thermoanaerobaculia bacterium]